MTATKNCRPVIGKATAIVLPAGSAPDLSANPVPVITSLRLKRTGIAVFLFRFLFCSTLILSGSAAFAQWSLTGNSITSSNWLGSTNDNDIIVKRNNVRAGFLNNANYNTSWGVGALNPSSPNTANTAIGYNVLAVNTTGGDNTGLGNIALAANTTGGWNVAMGMQSLTHNVGGNSNTASGYQSMYTNTSGGFNEASGFDALYSNISGTLNTANGYAALYLNTTGSSNVGEGQAALYSNTTGSNNTALGVSANVGSGTLTYATAIGSGAVVNTSNSLVLGGTGTAAVNVGIGTASPSQVLDVVGNVKFSGALMPNNTAGTSGQVLTSAGSGAVPTWTTLSLPSSSGTSGQVLTSAGSGAAPTWTTPLAANNGAGTSGYVLTSTGTAATWAAPAITAWSLTGGNAIVAGTSFLGSSNNVSLRFRTNNVENMMIDSIGRVGIGITNITDNDYKLYVEKGIRTRRVKVDVASWSDFVFAGDYKLPSLNEVENYIQQNKHLQDVPSAADVEKNGVDLGANQKVLLQKIEELTLYIIDQHKQIDAQHEEALKQNKEIQELQNQNTQLTQLKKEVDELKTLLQNK